jgi:predicted Zn-dependent peptidase
VQREIGIIDQEIGMNEDSPDARVFEDLMQCLYREHPIRVPILGSRESLREMTPELLDLCHRAFYTPANMILCIVGDVDAEAVVTLTEKVLGTQKKPVGQKLQTWQEKMRAEKSVCDCTMEVAMPTFQMAFKAEPAPLGEASVRAEIIGDLAAEALFGESSELYLQMYEEGLIDSSFGGGFESSDGCAMLTCGGDSYDAGAIRTAILERARQLADMGISEEDFLRMKRSALGRRIRDLDSFDSTCFRICAYHFDGFEYFNFPAVYAKIRQEEVLEFLRTVVTQERCALSVINPKEET